MTRQIGFILLVGAIVVVLAALLFPTFGQAKEAAKKTTEMSRLRHLEQQVAMMSDDAPLHTASRESGAPRSVARQATLSVDVDNLEKAENQMKESIAQAGGYIDHEEGNDLAGEQPSMRLTIRVPETSFEGTLSGFEKLGHRTEKSISASDLTEQILDAQAQIKQVKAVNATNSTAQLAQLQAERDQLVLKGTMSTIDLTLQQKPTADYAAAASTGWGSDTWNAALSSAIGTFRVVGAIAIWLFVYSPLWLVPCLVAMGFRKHWKRSQIA